MKSIALIVVATVVAFLGSSCETTAPVTPPPGGGHAGHDHADDHKPIPRLSWDLHSAGSGYDLDLRVGSEETHIVTGGEYMRGRSVSRTSRNVPAGTLSAFEVLLPDGEIDLYWIEDGRPGSLAVYGKSYDALDDRWSSERRLKMVTY